MFGYMILMELPMPGTRQQHDDNVNGNENDDDDDAIIRIVIINHFYFELALLHGKMSFGHTEYS